ncbi:MAG: choice-of-anchor D domain-containing protein [Acidobacteriota bacterium]
MIRRAGWLLLAPCCVLAQLQLALVEAGSERPAAGLLDLGTTDAGDVIDARFRLRNPGSAPATLRVLSVAGSGFTLSGPPILPLTVAAGHWTSFTVRFQSATYGLFAASLTVNTETVLLYTRARPALVLYVDEARGFRIVPAGSAVGFGSVERGSALSRRFRLENPGPTTMRLANMTMTMNGASWRGPAGLELPLTLAPQESVIFELTFAPQFAGPHQSILTVENRNYWLVAAAVEPPFPRPQVVLGPGTLASGQQARLTVRLASPSRRAGSGQLRLQFTPGVPGAWDDPAIRFLSPAGRVVTFTVEEGADTARFGEREEVEFQTGSTAGTLAFTVALGEHVEPVLAPLAPRPVVIDSAQASRAGGGLEVRLTGFDNSRSVSQAVFTFLDAGDRPVEPGPIRVDLAAEFRRYFETSTLGGVFAMRAVFPVTGDASRIAAVEAEMTNSIGTTRTERLRF